MGKVEGQFENGLKHGDIIEKRPDNHPKYPHFQGKYENDKRHGKGTRCMYWCGGPLTVNQTKVVTITGNYVNGKREGLFKKTTFHNRTSTTKDVWYENDKKVDPVKNAEGTPQTSSLCES